MNRAKKIIQMVMRVNDHEWLIYDEDSDYH